MKQSITQPIETIEAMRYLWAMVGVSAGVVEIIDCETTPTGERLTCRNKTSGALVSVTRGGPWTEDEERRYVHELDRALNGTDEAPAIAPSRDRAADHATVSPERVLVAAQ